MVTNDDSLVVDSESRNSNEGRSFIGSFSALLQNIYWGMWCFDHVCLSVGTRTVLDLGSVGRAIQTSLEPFIISESSKDEQRDEKCLGSFEKAKEV